MKEYPKIVACSQGYEVKTSAKVKLAGYYINERTAKAAMDRHIAGMSTKRKKTDAK